MRCHPSLIPLLTIGVFGSACAAATGTETQQARSSWGPITQSEIQQSVVGDALEAVQRLRPRWLRPRMGDSQPLVYMRNQRYGGIEWLRIIRCENVYEIRYVNARDATTRWGMGHSAGVIEVVPVT